MIIDLLNRARHWWLSPGMALPTSSERSPGPAKQQSSPPAQGVRNMHACQHSQSDHANHAFGQGAYSAPFARGVLAV